MSNVSARCKDVLTTLLIVTASWIALWSWWGVAAQAAFHLDYASGHEPHAGIPALVEVSGLETAPVPVLPAPEPPHPIVRPAPRVSGVSIWDRLAQCESGGNWASTDGHYEGGLQFDPSTWRSAGGTRYASHAYQASREQQIAVAQHWLAQTSWSQWPACSRRLGLR